MVDQERRREWDQEWTKQRRDQLIETLGSKCARCPSTEALEFDHRDPSEKSFNVGKNLHRTWPVLLKEIKKCQLLCGPCHREKTKEELSDAITFRGHSFPSKRAALRYFGIGWKTFYAEQP